jgi:hypothetical protein
MARYKGIVELSGKVGDLVFVKQKRTQFAKSKRTEPINQTEATQKAVLILGGQAPLLPRSGKHLRPLMPSTGMICLSIVLTNM